MLSKNIYCILLFAFLFCFSCNKDNIEEKTNRTVIVYMVADNDLSIDAYDNINNIIKGTPANLENNRLLIYLDPFDRSPQLIEITNSKNGIIKKVIKDYTEQNSLDPRIMKDILVEIITIYPSESYGLILWSHGTSWLPPGSTLRSFGLDRDDEMDIIFLEQSLPLKFEFIIFDACYMGSIEVVYQLRNKANYIISSPTEILSTGFPYELIVSDLFGNSDNLKNIANTFYQYYYSKNGAYQSASISLIYTGKLEELAEKTNKLLTDNSLKESMFNIDNIQNFDSNRIGLTYDFFDFLEKNYHYENIKELKTTLDEVVIAKYHTPYFLDKYQIIQFCGLSCYIPNINYSGINNYYKNLFWYIDGGFYNLF